MTRPEIIDVWQDNLEVEMNIIRNLVESYPYIGMDTEFPGVVARPIGTFSNTSDYHYQTLRCNVDMLKLIQLGLTLCDANGRRPEGTCCWQFNFRFSLHEDMYSPESIELLTNSGLVLLDEVKWIAFQGGYDFGYILKLVSLVALPAAESDFFDLLKIWFPCIYDVKYLMRSCKSLRGGLNDVAKDLGVERLGKEHQAGSDSFVTAAVFFAMRTQFFEDSLDDAKYMNQVHGFNQGQPSQHHQVSIGDDPHALSTDPLVPTATTNNHSNNNNNHGQPHSRRSANVRSHLPIGSFSAPEGIASVPAPRASSAVSIKNPNAGMTTTSATTEGLLGALHGRTGSPAVR